MQLHVAIIEDEPAIARNLEYLLQDIDPEIVVLHKITGVTEAISWLDKNLKKCDLLFMDIQLNDGISFEIFNSIPATVVPVIFITAYDNYALEAFKVNSIDYILKPFDKQNLITALDKFKATARSFEGLYADNHIADLLKYFEEGKEKTYKKAYLVHFQNKLIPLPVEKIYWFYTEDEIVYAFTADGKKYVLETTLEKVQAEVSPDDFFRANRQFIVQRQAITTVDFYFNGRLIVNTLLKAEEKIIISKAKSPAFKNWLNR